MTPCVDFDSAPSRLGAVALDWAAMGVPVLPVQPRGKRPMTEHGVRDATTDEATVRDWWAKWPDANVGLAGSPRLVFLDVDAGRDGVASLDAINRTHRLARTRKVASGGGGVHLHFEPNGTVPANSTDRVGPGIEVRGLGQYVLAPGSIHPNGRRSRVVDDAPPAPVPAWMHAVRKTEVDPGVIDGWEEVARPRIAELIRDPDVKNCLPPRRFPSSSERDFAMAGAVCKAGGTPAEAAAVIVAIRRRSDPNDAKAQRVGSYLAPTVGRGFDRVGGEGDPTVARLVARARQYLHFTDADHWLFALAIAVTGGLEGDPTWGLIVGAPSSGKTEAIRSLDDVADAHVDDITAAGLIGWRSKRGGKGEMTGLLARVGSHALATIADLSTLLDMSNKGSREELYSLLRRAYDGRVVREYNGPPEPLVWEGRITLLAAVTPSIDNFASHSDALGPRWLYHRLGSMSSKDAKLASRAARDVQGQEEHRRAVRGLASRIVPPAVVAAREARLADDLNDLLDDAARVATLGRTSVERESFGSRDITNVPQPEEPMRLSRQLGLLARAYLGLGLSRSEVERLTVKAALDSMPENRRRCVDLLGTGRPFTATAVARGTGMDRKVTTRALEDLAAIGIAVRTESDWRLAKGDDARGIRVVTKKGRG